MTEFKAGDRVKLIDPERSQSNLRDAQRLVRVGLSFKDTYHVTGSHSEKVWIKGNPAPFCAERFELAEDHPDGETRAVDPSTGGAKGRKPVELSHIAPEALEELGGVASMGAEKYEAYNYLKGFPFSWSYNALQRHLMAFWGGEDYDPESGYLHLAHAMWHCAALIAFMRRDLGTDDRPPRG